MCFQAIVVTCKEGFSLFNLSQLARFGGFGRFSEDHPVDGVVTKQEQQ